MLVLGLAVAGAAVAGGSVGSGDRSGSRPAAVPARIVIVTTGGRPVVRQPLEPGAAVNVRTLRRALSRRLPPTIATTRGRARIIYRYDLSATVRRAEALGSDGGTVEATRSAMSSRILAPVLRQAQTNTCESAALEILLAAAGKRIPQGQLQAAFPTSGRLDPVGSGSQRAWGDPDRGYVGRPNGGGVAGGFGIYPAPVAATARSFGRVLDDLTGSRPSRLYTRLLRGRAVMAWIGLSEGPYGDWRSPQGKPIRVNFGEHTIVLNGMTRDGRLRVVNPLMGTAELWSRTRFEAAWKLLGRRALGT